MGPRRRSPAPPSLPIELPPEILPGPVADDVLDRVVADLNALHRAAGLELTLRIGHLIVEAFYGGQVESWRERGPRDVSFRRLAARSDLQLSASALQRCVATYELCDRLGVSTWQHLGPSHLRAVFGLPESAQRALLTAAESQQWTVHELSQQALHIKRRAPESRGRKRLPRVIKTVNQMARWLEAPDEHFSDLGAMDELDIADATRIHATVAEMKRRCEAILDQLHTSFIGLT